MKSNFLIELGTEELPPTSLVKLSTAFANVVVEGLKTKNLSFESYQVFATPRRMAVLIRSLETQTALKEVKVFGPPAKIAFDDKGQLSKAGLAFCSRNNIEAGSVQRENDGKAEKIFCLKSEGGTKTEALLPDLISLSLKKLPIAKRMRWGTGSNEFVRPVHWLVVLNGDKVVPCEIMGLKSDRLTRGHRFHYNQNLEIHSADSYEEQLRDTAKIIACFKTRQAIIRKQVEAQATANSATAIIGDELLEEVTGLVEWPVALLGKFDESFLAVPKQALISSMKEHQKYFHLVDNNNNLLPYFITVANIEAKDPQVVIAGNERVIRPRLADAAFFYDTDKKTSSEVRREKLRTVVFQAKLGSVFDKTERLKKLIGDIAAQLSIDATDAQRAAELSKSDLVSNMVGEFPGMQGIAGHSYALNDGENTAVALAIEEQYLPKFSGDGLPSSEAGMMLAIADRLDTLTGIFGIGQAPTGSKDPFGLRRASVSLLRIVIDKGLALDLAELVEKSASYHQTLQANNDTQTSLNYILDRLRSAYLDTGISAEVYMAVSAKKVTRPLDIDKRVAAVAAFNTREEALALAAANKRVANILSKLEEPIVKPYDGSLFELDAEKNLATALEEVKEQVEDFAKASDYASALDLLAGLRGVVDAFFDDVMVMCEDEELKNNRLALLQTLRSLFLQIADISCLAIK
ncbi:MAG: glycyl-tRNA synthetase beta chain [Flavobacteriales bacterium]|jgi:glycyl-tRNA synthetase beta chain